MEESILGQFICILDRPCCQCLSMNTCYTAPTFPAILSPMFPPISLYTLQRSIAKQRLSQDRERAALRLLAFRSADGSEVGDVCGDGWGVGAVEVSHVEDVGSAALRGAVGAAADDRGLTGVEVLGGCWGGEGQAREGGEREDGEELHFGFGLVLRVVRLNCLSWSYLKMLCCAGRWMME